MPSADGGGDDGHGQPCHQPGSVVRLKVTNFMAYSETEFQCGPNLNVIIGPNGSGKSTIISAICLGLAGKPKVLGRSADLQAYVKNGEEEATVEVELYQQAGPNIIIHRCWNREGKSNWKINNKKAGLREVEKRVKELQIQVDNLCQFLPQDKVHDFSKLTSKGLLDSTIDAVGETELKEKHAELKDLQKAMSGDEDLFDRKRQLLNENTLKLNQMKDEVQAFNEKKEVEEKIRLLEGRLAWSLVSEAKKVAKEALESCTASKAALEENESKMTPFKNELQTLRNKKTKYEGKLQSTNNSTKQSIEKARDVSKKIEDLDKQVDLKEDELDDINVKEARKKEEITGIQSQIAELEQESQSIQDDDTAEAQLKDARAKTVAATRMVTELKHEKETLKYEFQSISRKEEGLNSELKRLNNIDELKLRKLKELNDDAAKAFEWLKQNRHMFKGEVYEPFILCGNVPNEKQAKYLEMNIQRRDLTAFFFESSQDMNIFLDLTRNKMKLEKTSAVQLPQQSSNDFRRRSLPAGQLVQYGFEGYLQDMVTGPDKVIAYMCYTHGLHRIPVFNEKAEKHNDRFIEMGFTKFIIGVKQQSITTSSYSSNKTTMTREVVGDRTMSISKDTGREEEIKHQMAEVDSKRKEISMKIQELEKKEENQKIVLDQVRKAQREIEQRRQIRQNIAARIESLKKKLRQTMSAGSPEEERRKVLSERKAMICRQVKLVQQLKNVISESTDLRISLELTRVCSAPLDEQIEEKQKEIEEARGNDKELQNQVNQKEREYEECRSVWRAKLTDAKTLTGAATVAGKKEEPPQKVKDAWEAHQFPTRVEDVEVKMAELKAQAECMDTVDPRVVRHYNELKDTVEELENDIARREQAMQNNNRQMEEVKASWLRRLESLVERINRNFSSHFASMGFAGEIGLKAGQHENDFENYGIVVRVKYRDTEPLKELTATHQSGGERSVATALYMLALQELTTVPFRCVDEINQGMDARNERKVFELLVRTSCAEHSAQYFLLTPKLLTGLNYSERMTILIVNNGEGMCSYKDWNMEAFHAIAGS